MCHFLNKETRESMQMPISTLSAYYPDANSFVCLFKCVYQYHLIPRGPERNKGGTGNTGVHLAWSDCTLKIIRNLWARMLDWKCLTLRKERDGWRDTLVYLWLPIKCNKQNISPRKHVHHQHFYRSFTGVTKRVYTGTLIYKHKQHKYPC